MIPWTSNRLSAGMYADMNIGNVVQHQSCEVETEWEENWETEYEVNMTGQCYTCGGVGHPQRLCPSKGQGKGKGKSIGGAGGFGGKGYPPQQQSAPSGYGKSYGKGSVGKGFGGKGYGKALGKGYQCNCYNCGKKGHKSAECRSPPVNQARLVEAEPEAAEPEIRDVGGVWHWAVPPGRFVGNIEKVKIQPKKTIPIRNSFNTLTTVDEDNDFVCVSLLVSQPR